MKEVEVQYVTSKFSSNPYVDSELVKYSHSE